MDHFYRQCKVCGTTKLVREFYRRSKSPTGYQSTCKKCSNAATNRARTKRYKNSEVARDLDKARNRCRKYGITLDEYYTLKETAECEVCKRPDKLVIDHDHKTGQVRGLLCQNHNMGIGLFNESIEHMQSAIQYLQKHQ